MTPSFLAVALNAAARSQVSRTALIPYSVKCRVVMKVAIVVPSHDLVGTGGILSRLTGLVVRREVGISCSPARWAQGNSRKLIQAGLADCRVGPLDHFGLDNLMAGHQPLPSPGQGRTSSTLRRGGYYRFSRL